MKKVSIIVPVYNAATTLHTCLESILGQTYPDIELIIVNDGSTDASQHIAVAYEKQDARVQVHEQPNSGPGHARNTGLTAATGHFVQFVDADDELVPDTTAQLVEQIKSEIDLVLCTYKKDGIIKKLPISAGAYAQHAFLQQLGVLYVATLLPSPCNKMYRLPIIRTHQLVFPTHTAYGEDLQFNLDYLSHCRKIYCLDHALYFYQSQAESLTNRFIPELFLQQKQLYDVMRQFLQEEGSWTIANQEALQHTFARDSLYAASNLFHRDNDSNDQIKALKQIMQDSHVRQSSNYFPTSVQGRLWKYFIQRQAYRQAALFFRMKAWVKGRLS